MRTGPVSSASDVVRVTLHGPGGHTARPEATVDLVTVTVGEDYLGAVMTDLSGRRGQVLGSDSVNRKAIVRALVPQAELTRYAIDLRGLARGSGSFSRKFHGYEVMPTNLAQEYMKA